MNVSTRRTSLFLPIVLFTVIALALYLLVVWDPIGIYGSIRQYLEHPIRAPLEWIVLLSPVPYERPYQAVSCRGLLTPLKSSHNLRIVSNA
jgi:hypothetical protein